MPGSKKFSRKQMKDLKRQVKSKREQIIHETTTSPEEVAEKINNLNTRKDKLGFSNEDRREISERITNLEKKVPTLSWNYDVGSLVYLPNGDVGIIVKNNAKQVEVAHHDYDMKKIMTGGGRYAGQVYVVTSEGNNWYYPRQLKIVRE